MYMLKMEWAGGQAGGRRQEDSPVLASQEQLVKQRLHVVVVELDDRLVAIAELAPDALVVIDTVLQAVDAAARRQYQ